MELVFFFFCYLYGTTLELLLLNQINFRPLLSIRWLDWSESYHLLTRS